MFSENQSLRLTSPNTAILNRVGVVILTYNRLPLLRLAICKVFEQDIIPTELLIVDNFSSDGTRDFLRSQDNITSIFLDENLGPAGGFYYGIKYFAEQNEVDYVWLMDDDFFPAKKCLSELLKVTNKDLVVFPYVREKDFRTRLKPGWWGVLIPLPIIHQVGYPMKELFFWAEDTEYLQHRIKDVHNFTLKWIPKAKGVHFTKRQRNYRADWRYYYEIRNTIYSIYFRKLTLKRFYKLVKSFIGLLGGILFKEREKINKLKYFSIGTYHGLTKKIGKTLDPKGGFIK